MRGLVATHCAAPTARSAHWPCTGVYVRVAHTLIGTAEDRGRRCLARSKEKVSRQDVAKMVGASREMVSRVMKEFEEQGFIRDPRERCVLMRERRARPR